MAYRSRPNILLLQVDDLAAWCQPFMGDSYAETPRLSELARRGVLFANAYAPTPVCSPARASLWTGLLPCRHGIHDFLKENDPEAPTLRGQITLAQQFQAQGYHTGLVGKWHCGNSHLPQPGFDHWFSYQQGQYPHLGLQRFVCRDQPIQWEGFQSDRLLDEALSFLRDAPSNQPWLLYFGPVNTHSPFINQPGTLVEKYRAKLRDRPPPVQHPDARYDWIRFGTPPDEDTRLEWLAQYYAAVETIDHMLARLLQAVDLADTIVVYTSDHGHMNGHHGLYTKGNATVPQNFYEEALRIPLVVAGPDTRVARDLRIDEPVNLMDLHETLVDWAGLKPVAPPDRPGQSLSDLIAGRTHPLPRPPMLFEYGNARAIRSGPYKLVRRYHPYQGPLNREVYDLEYDPGEVHDLADLPAFDALSQALEQEMTAAFARYEPPGYRPDHILASPPCNACEPWRLLRPAETPEYGSDLQLLGYGNPRLQ